MDDQLLTLLEYDGVLGVLATTPDGLVVAAAGLEGDDAEIVGAAGSTIWTAIEEAGEKSGTLEAGSAVIHVLHGTELSLVALTEESVPHDPLVEEMEKLLEIVRGVFA